MPERPLKPATYGEAGVQPSPGLGRVLDVLRGTFGNRRGLAGEPVLDFGYYANVLRLTDTLGLAISTDGVGTKLLVAEMMGKYDTVGIDCVAMNVNDIVCVGAEPVAMVDYIAVERLDERQLREIAVGLEEGARQAHISIPGGELAQVPEMIRGAGDAGEAFDLVGTAVGVVPLDRIVTGERAQPGDVLVGYASSGIHSNGLTLARKVLLDERREWTVETHVAELGRTLGEELLEPTRIYVGLVLELLRRVDVRALFHITGDGFLNLRRIPALVGFEIDKLPPLPPIFDLIRSAGGVGDAEMYRVFNMGIGFCAVVPQNDAAAAVAIAKDLGIDAWVLARCVADEAKTVRLRPLGLVGTGGEFRPE